MSSKIAINKRVKGLPREELEKLEKNELIEKIIQLEAYNFQLKNILNKKLNVSVNSPQDQQLIQELSNLQAGASTQSKQQSLDTKFSSEDFGASLTCDQKGKKREFDFGKCTKRHVLLKLLYFGWDYQGFACQEDSNATIEYHLFKALTRCCLIESRDTSNYHRCGRTDKEVSAFCQVISIDLRSKISLEKQLSVEGLLQEIDYCSLLNRILPKNIQCIAWMPLKSPVYSARFDCVARTYRYFFPKGDLNIEAMQKACLLLQRHADFRNFCKMDVHNGVTNYIRNLRTASIHLCPNEIENDHASSYQMYYLQIEANAFLWHQIRCIMAILLLIGQEKEEPDVINQLLDVEKNPCKPQYTPAIGLPLNLFHCEFRTKTCRKTDEELVSVGVEEDSVNLVTDVADSAEQNDISDWIYNEENLQKLIENIQSEWTQYNIKSTMIRNVLFVLENTLHQTFKTKQIESQVLLLQDCVKPRQYQKLLNRKRCESLENRIEHFVKKQRLIIQPKTSSSNNSSI